MRVLAGLFLAPFPGLFLFLWWQWVCPLCICHFRGLGLGWPSGALSHHRELQDSDVDVRARLRPRETALCLGEPAWGPPGPRVAVQSPGCILGPGGCRGGRWPHCLRWPLLLWPEPPANSCPSLFGSGHVRSCAWSAESHTETGEGRSATWSWCHGFLWSLLVICSQTSCLCSQNSRDAARGQLLPA